MLSSLYNYIFNYKYVKCCGCQREMCIKNPIENMNYSCSNGCTFKAFYESQEKNESNNTKANNTESNNTEPNNSDK